MLGRQPAVQFRLRSVMVGVSVWCVSLGLWLRYGIDVAVLALGLAGVAGGYCAAVLRLKRTSLAFIAFAAGAGGSIGASIASTIICLMHPDPHVILWLLHGVPSALTWLVVGTVAGLLWHISLQWVVLYRERLPARRWLCPIMVTVGVCAVTILWHMPWPYREEVFSGNGHIVDYGYWSYPRYSIQFPVLDLNEGDTYILRVCRPPPIKAALELHPTTRVGSSVVSGKVDIEVSIEETSGRESQTIAAGRIDRVTVIAGVKEALFSSQCAIVPLDSNKSYVVAIHVGRLETWRRIEVEAVISGGGFELP